VRTKAVHRLYAAKVAAMATAAVMVTYLIAVIVLNIFVVHRLTSQADARLSERLVDARREVLSVPKTGSPTVQRDHGVDDAPAFVWAVSSTGAVTSLTTGAPQLPRYQWSTSAITIGAGGTSFRFQAVTSGSGWLVAGEGIGQIKRVEDTLFLPEAGVGVAVLIFVYAGALVIGLRASAPLELVRRRQTEFTADASHELRTPLSVIEAEVDLALSRPRSTDAYRAVLTRVSGEGRRLRSIVNDLLWLARVDDESPRLLEGDDVDVAANAETGVDRFQAVATAGGVALSFHREGLEPALLQTNPAWIDRLIGVLVDNACRYAGSGGAAEVRVRTTATRIVLDVDDSGPGIPVENRAAVFDRFHRGAEDLGGTGLGLAIADSVVRATGGSWSIRTAPLGGARMEVSWRKGGGRPASGKGTRRLRFFRRHQSETQAAAPVDPVTDRNQPVPM
jgi:signal transduction histidine kinase